MIMFLLEFFFKSIDNFIQNIGSHMKEGAVKFLRGHYTTTEKETPSSLLNPISVIPLLLS